MPALTDRLAPVLVLLLPLLLMHAKAAAEAADRPARPRFPAALRAGARLALAAPGLGAAGGGVVALAGAVLAARHRHRRLAFLRAGAGGGALPAAGGGPGALAAARARLAPPPARRADRGGAVYRPERAAAVRHRPQHVGLAPLCRRRAVRPLRQAARRRAGLAPAVPRPAAAGLPPAGAQPLDRPRWRPARWPSPGWASSC